MPSFTESNVSNVEEMQDEEIAGTVGLVQETERKEVRCGYFRRVKLRWQYF